MFVDEAEPLSGNGTQQLLSIPVSLAAGGGSSIQILTTSNGQLIATNLAQPLSLATSELLLVTPGGHSFVLLMRCARRHAETFFFVESRIKAVASNIVSIAFQTKPRHSHRCNRI